MDSEINFKIPQKNKEQQTTNAFGKSKVFGKIAPGSNPFKFVAKKTETAPSSEAPVQGIFSTSSRPSSIFSTKPAATERPEAPPVLFGKNVESKRTIVDPSKLNNEIQADQRNKTRPKLAPPSIMNKWIAPKLANETEKNPFKTGEDNQSNIRIGFRGIDPHRLEGMKKSEEIFRPTKGESSRPEVQAFQLGERSRQKPFDKSKLTANSSSTRETAAILQQLEELQNRHCPDDYSRYMVLEDRDKCLYKLRAEIDKNSPLVGKRVVKGTLSSMCAEKERYVRSVQKRISTYECDENGEIDPNRLIKEYSRSAADQEKPLAHELRRPETLRLTMNYLLTNILDFIPDSDEELGGWYSYLWDRTRAIRKEITQLMMADELAVSLLECCTRFHIICAYLLCSQDVDKFDQKMNTENLGKSLQTLRHLYEDLAKKGIFCSTEAEFRSYDVLLHLHDSNVLRQVLAYRKEVREAPSVRLAIQLASAMQTNNFARKKANYLQCCICHRFFTQIRSKALEVLNKASNRTGNISLQIEYLIKVLAFDDEQNALNVLGEFGIYPSDANGDEVILTREHMNITAQPQLVTYKWIDLKNTSNLSETVNGGTVVASDEEIPKIFDSFDQNGYYRNDPVLSEVFKKHSINIFSSKKLAEEPTNLKIIVQAEIAAREEKEREEREQKAKAEEERLKKIKEDKIRQELEEKLKRAELERQHQLEIKKAQEEERKRMDLKHRGNAVLQNLCSVVQEQAVSYLLKGVVIDEIDRFKTQQKQFRGIAQSLSDNLLASVVDNQLKTIAKNILRTRIKEVEEGLSLHKQRFSNLWLKQFWDQWKCKVEARKEARRIRNSAWEEFKPNWNASLFSPDRYLSSSALFPSHSEESSLTTKQRLVFAQLRRSRMLKITKNAFEHWKQFTERKIQEKAQAEIIKLALSKRPFSLRRPHPTESCDYSSFIRDDSPARKSVKLTLEESLHFPTVPTWINLNNTLFDDSSVPNSLEESVVTEEDVSIARRELERTTLGVSPKSQERNYFWESQALDETEMALEETKLEATDLINECRQSQKRSDDLKKKAAILVESLQKHRTFMSQLEEDVLRKRQTK